MLRRSAYIPLKQVPLMRQSARFIGYKKESKDYYAILGLSRQATLDEVKDAYKEMAKKYHPDVSSQGEGYTEDASKFRDVIEAYSVLKHQESRFAYDQTSKQMPEHVFEETRREMLKQNSRTFRDKTGASKGKKKTRGDYEKERLEVIHAERKKYNVDQLGRYRGGLPVKNHGAYRRGSMGGPGAYHQPEVHNFIEHQHPDTQFVTTSDAMQFKNYMNNDKVQYQRKWPYVEAAVDYDHFYFEKFVRFSIVLGAVIFFGKVLPWGYGKFEDLQNAYYLKNANAYKDVIQQTESGIVSYK